jgi:hypothetical protein
MTEQRFSRHTTAILDRIPTWSQDADEDLFQATPDRVSAKPAKHTCGGPVFGRKTPGCPRCDELIAGAAPVQWNTGWKRENERREALYSRQHHATCPICTGRQSGVCTWGEW